MFLLVSVENTQGVAPYVYAFTGRAVVAMEDERWTAPGLERGVAPPGLCPWPQAWGSGVAPPPPPPQPRAWGMGYLFPAVTPDLGRWVSPLGRPLNRGCAVAPLGHCPSGMGSSQLLLLTSDVGWLLSPAF